MVMGLGGKDPRIMITSLVMSIYLASGSYGLKLLYDRGCDSSINGGVECQGNGWFHDMHLTEHSQPEDPHFPSGGTGSSSGGSVENVSLTSTPTTSPKTGQVNVRRILFTNGRWIVDSSGKRVKLTCVNWPSHLELSVAEGLNHKSVDMISKMIVSMSFNCVRFTWPVQLATNQTLANMTLRESFETNGLNTLIPDVEANNPSLVDLPLIEVFQAIVRNLADNNLMVILDNHLSKPGWCCSNKDGNGFFGDEFFNPEEWVKGLTNMARMFKGAPYSVVAMSIRNELRGPRQDVNDWYTYMQRGAEAVHATNSDVLIILSGLDYDLDLSFLKTRQVNLSFINKNKVVFEFHRYSFSGGDREWENNDLNNVCGSMIDTVKNNAVFLLKKWPLIMTEFGIHVLGTSANDNRFFDCLLTVLVDYDLDWAYWVLGGSYYRRSGIVGCNETFGLLTSNWDIHDDLTKSGFMQKLSAIQTTYQGPKMSKEDQIIFHPTTGLCVRTNSLQDPYLTLGQCANMSDFWSYDIDSKTLTITKEDGNTFKLQADGIDKPVKLKSLSSFNSQWRTISNSKLHLSTKLNNSIICLDVQRDSQNINIITTNACKCLNNDKACDPTSQWFKLVTIMDIN